MTFSDDLWQQSEAMQRPLLTLRGAIAGAKGYLLARLFAERGVPLLVVTPDARQRDFLYDDIRCFLNGMSVTVSPWQHLADMVCRYEHQVTAPAGTISYQQSRAIYTYQPLWRLVCGTPVLVVTSVDSLQYGVVPIDHLRHSWFHVRVGALMPRQHLIVALVEQGYRRVPVVEAVGEFAVRGGIVDFFSPGHQHPVRLEFFGEEIETIRTFEAQSQRSAADVLRDVRRAGIASASAYTGFPGGVCSTPHVAGRTRLERHAGERTCRILGYSNPCSVAVGPGRVLLR